MNIRTLSETAKGENAIIPKKIYKIKNPSGIKVIVIMIIFIILQLKVIVVNVEDDKAFFVGVALVVVYATILGMSTYRTFKKSSNIEYRPEALIVHGKLIRAEDIEMILINGYFKPILGIKLTEKKIVPINLCFRFIQDEDNAIQELKKWASERNIKVKNKYFVRWI
ncbi:hypothetical protein [Paenibacillus rigui]|uniref:hypothetical protein n=1 Tax=Paenibacillus rigui TaxID=554312 RepID=UPI00117D1CFC|nr:hypothetical protein [Paenibacillus rigui]